MSAAAASPEFGAEWRSGSLRAEVVAAGHHWSTSQQRLVRLVAALDRSGEWALDGARTCAHWIAAALDIEVCTAREWLRVGHALTELEVVDRAFADGRLSYSKVRTLTRVTTVDNQSELCALAETVPAGRLAHTLAAWLTRHEAPEQTERRQRDARAMSRRLEPDGTITTTVRLPPASDAALWAAVDTQMLQDRPTAPNSTTRTQGGSDASADASSPRPVRVWPSLRQQRADALIALVTGGGARVITEIVLHVRADGCTLDDGTPITGTVVERLASQAFLRALIHDAESRPINASGRQRHPTARQRRVVHERDRTCVDCGTSELLEYDHDPPYETTGRTVIEELRLRCIICHHSRHRDVKRRRRRRRRRR
jgi:hypothetical protein